MRIRLHDAIKAYLKKHLDSARFKHTLGTARIAVMLAEKNGVRPEKALTAALLHDAGKGYSRKGMILYVARHRLVLPQKELVIRLNPSLLHSYISAHLAKTVFGIKARDVLSAIAQHTVGGAKMSTLAKIMYLADSVSYDRRYPGVKQMRALAFSDLDTAVRKAMANKLYYVIKKKAWLHPEAVKAWNAAVAV